MTDEQESREKEQQSLSIAFRQTFIGSDHGRKVYSELERICLKRDQTYCPGDPYKSAFNAGAREVILRIDDQLTLAEREPKQIEVDK